MSDLDLLYTSLGSRIECYVALSGHFNGF